MATVKSMNCEEMHQCVAKISPIVCRQKISNFTNWLPFGEIPAQAAQHAIIYLAYFDTEIRLFCETQ